MTIDIIIPNYNGSHLYEKNLPYVFRALEGYSGKVIVVDDGSKDADKKALEQIIAYYKEKGEPIEFVEHKKNWGFSSAINSGVLASTSEFVVLLNSDVRPRHDFLKSPLMHLRDDKDLFGVGCMDESVEHEGIVLRGRGLARWNEGFLAHSKGEPNKSNTFWISGGSCVLRREIFNKIYGMDELYNPFYWEDIDLSYRAQKAGYSILFDTQSVVEHYHDEGAIKKQFKSEHITKISQRNQFIFVWKNITDKNLLLNHFVWLPRHIVMAVIKGNKTFLQGLFLALVKLPAIMNNRQKQKKLYKLSDAEVINSFHE